VRNEPSITTRRKYDGRELHALAACLMWLLGFEVAPLAHIATHVRGERHHHDATGATARDAESHEHGHEHGQEHGHVHIHESDRDTKGAPGVEGSPAPHGAHSLLHRGIAALAPKVPTPVVPPPAIHALVSLRAPRDLIASRAPESARARGPPVRPV
jgi:hypothetical protein